ncbi:MAG TPA: hypothetical protein VF546_12340 [Pyrinomonadaceae bacterium]
MKVAHLHPARRVVRRLTSVVALCAFAALPLLSSARPPAASINVVNNSSREIIHIYLAHADGDDWGPNQLGNASIAPGQSFTLANVSCDQAQIKVVAEDQNGCFLSAVVACGGDSTWSLTNNTPADCGQ